MPRGSQMNSQMMNQQQMMNQLQSSPPNGAYGHPNPQIGFNQQMMGNSQQMTTKQHMGNERMFRSNLMRENVPQQRQDIQRQDIQRQDIQRQYQQMDYNHMQNANMKMNRPQDERMIYQQNMRDFSQHSLAGSNQSMNMMNQQQMLEIPATKNKKNKQVNQTPMDSGSPRELKTDINSSKFIKEFCETNDFIISRKKGKEDGDQVFNHLAQSPTINSQMDNNNGNNNERFVFQSDFEKGKQQSIHSPLVYHNQFKLNSGKAGAAAQPQMQKRQSPQGVDNNGQMPQGGFKGPMGNPAGPMSTGPGYANRTPQQMNHPPRQPHFVVMDVNYSMAPENFKSLLSIEPVFYNVDTEAQCVGNYLLKKSKEERDKQNRNRQ